MREFVFESFGIFKFWRKIRCFNTGFVFYNVTLQPNIK